MVATGIEVAGLVLAVLPLFISALEHYHDGCEPIKAFWTMDKELPMHIRKLRNQHVHYEQTLRILLLSIAESEDVSEMIEAPNGDLWKTKEMQTKLEGRLGESYHAYHETISHMEDLMKKLAKDLKIDDNERANRTNLQNLLSTTPRKDSKYEFRRRVRFGMSRRKFKFLLDELDESSKELERFTEKSERLDSFRSSSNSNLKSTFQPPLTQIRAYASNLYSVLCLGMSCQASHRAHLQLERRLASSRASRRQASSRNHSDSCCQLSTKGSDITIFRVSLNYPDLRISMAEISSTCALQSFHPVNISRQVSSRNPDMIVPQFRTPDLPILDKDEQLNGVVSQVITSLPPSTHFRKKVAWVVDPPTAEAGSVSLGTTTGPPDMQEVLDICTAIQAKNWPSSCLGFHLDCNGKLRGGYSVTEATEHQKSATRTLEDLLKPANASTCSRRLTRKERMTLAVTLASSYLQLYATPWLRDSWGKADVVFNCVGGTSPADAQIDIDRPYVSQGVSTIKQGPPSGLSPETQSSDPVSATLTSGLQRSLAVESSGNLSLLALGIILLELYTNEPFESHASARSTGLTGPDEEINRLRKLSDASKWTNSIEDDLSEAYLHAVRHCIRSYFDGACAKDEKMFRQAVLDQVVLPLQEELQTFLGRRS